MAVICGVMALGFLGCKSPIEGPAAKNALASVLITNSSPGTVAITAKAVFEDHAFTTTKFGLTDMVFESEGTRSDNLVWGDWSGKSVGYRVNLRIRMQSNSMVLLECTAFVLTDRGDRQFEEEHRIGRTRASSYRKLLEEIRTRLAQK